MSRAEGCSQPCCSLGFRVHGWGQLWAAMKQQGMAALAERRHKWNVQGKYHPHFCEAEMALLQHLSQQFPNSVFGSPETHGSWSQVWCSTLLSAGVQGSGLAAWRRLGTSPWSCVWKGGSTPRAGAESTAAAQEQGQYQGSSVMKSSLVVSGKELYEPALQGISHLGLQQMRMVFQSLLTWF